MQKSKEKNVVKVKKSKEIYQVADSNGARVKDHIAFSTKPPVRILSDFLQSVGIVDGCDIGI